MEDEGSRGGVSGEVAMRPRKGLELGGLRRGGYHVAEKGSRGGAGGAECRAMWVNKGLEVEVREVAMRARKGLEIGRRRIDQILTCLV